MIKTLACFAILASLSHAAHNILDYGAIHKSELTIDAFSNANATILALLLANASDTDREILIPEGYSFVMMPVRVDYLVNVTIRVEGEVLMSADDVNFPTTPNKTSDWASNGNISDFWNFEYSNGLRFTGHGRIDGRGFDWWVREFHI